jgi:hypothetical protein
MRRALLVVSIGLGACGGMAASKQEMLIDPGPAPTNGLQLVLPIVRGIQPGTDNELCTWTDLIPDRDLYVKSIQGIQSVTGHHLILYKTKMHQPAGTTRPCTDNDLTTVRFVGGAGGEGSLDKDTAPGDLVFTIEQGYQVVINHHYLNASPQAHDVQSAVNLYYADQSVHFTPSGAMVVVDTDLHLPPGEPTKDIDCTMQEDMKVWFMVPHMHAYGVNETVDHVRVDGTTERLFDTPWTPELTFHPPQRTADPTAPILMRRGDHVKVHCEWQNTTQRELTFGLEMCVFFAQTVDDIHLGNRACNAGDWGPF